MPRTHSSSSRGVACVGDHVVFPMILLPRWGSLHALLFGVRMYGNFFFLSPLPCPYDSPPLWPALPRCPHACATGARRNQAQPAAPPSLAVSLLAHNPLLLPRHHPTLIPFPASPLPPRRHHRRPARGLRRPEWAAKGADALAERPTGRSQLSAPPPPPHEHSLASAAPVINSITSALLCCR